MAKAEKRMSGQGGRGSQNNPPKADRSSILDNAQAAADAVSALLRAPVEEFARGEGVAEFLRFDADGGEHGRLSRICRLVAARVVGGCRVLYFGW